jgi:hypothetical protein
VLCFFKKRNKLNSSLLNVLEKMERIMIAASGANILPIDAETKHVMYS